ncbi:MAG: hypothetical protein EPN85_10260 [Bacteroidetes bacterium]|nr:MAG: hypothetical protein EPN85_10260 [Bacteroidota bacterium]
MKILNRLTIPFIAIVILWAASNTHWKDGKYILIGDAQGYYSYLPAVFIYKNLNFGFYDSIGTKYFEASKYDYRTGHNGETINKYYCGTAIAMLPFFGAAHLFTLVSSGPADGFSKYYTIFAQIACISWLIVGLIYLRKLLKFYTEKEGLVSFALIAIVFGTNIFYYTISEPGVSHIFSFAFITLFVYYVRCFISVPKNRYLLFCFALLGIIFLLRPVNLLILFSIPFLADSFASLKASIDEVFKRRKYFIAGIPILLLIISIQTIIYKISAGSFWIDSYRSEHFVWNKLNMIDFLFSYKKGMFLYTPLLFVCLLGCIKIRKENRYGFFSLIGFLALLIYVFSSWWQWFYGGSFSCRVMIEYYAFFAILFVESLLLLKRNFSKTAFIAAICTLIIICQIQTYQYRYNHIHWSEMNKERYWNVFMRVDLLLKHQNPNEDLLVKISAH